MFSKRSPWEQPPSASAVLKVGDWRRSDNQEARRCSAFCGGSLKPSCGRREHNQFATSRERRSFPESGEISHNKQPPVSRREAVFQGESYFCCCCWLGFESVEASCSRLFFRRLTSTRPPLIRFGLASPSALAGVGA